MIGTDFDLTLYVSGASQLSSRAVVDTQRLCETHLEGRYRLSVVDVHEHPDAGVASGVLVVPALVRNRPLPERRLAGDLSQADRVLAALGLAEVT